MRGKVRSRVACVGHVCYFPSLLLTKERATLKRWDAQSSPGQNSIRGETNKSTPLGAYGSFHSKRLTGQISESHKHFTFFSSVEQVQTTYLVQSTSKRKFLVLPLSTATCSIHSSALSRTLDPVFVNAKAFKTNRTSSMHFVGTDTDLSAKAKAHTIRHSCTAVPELASTVDAVAEAIGGLF
jgi:hypothetical protein